MDQSPPDPAKLLAFWLEWERGETPPGRVLSNLKTAGMLKMFEDLVARQEATASAEEAS